MAEDLVVVPPEGVRHLEFQEHPHETKRITDYRQALVIGATYHVISGGHLILPTEELPKGEEFIVLVVCRMGTPEVRSFILQGTAFPPKYFSLDDRGNPQIQKPKYTPKESTCGPRAKPAPIVDDSVAEEADVLQGTSGDVPTLGGDT